MNQIELAAGWVSIQTGNFIGSAATVSLMATDHAATMAPAKKKGPDVDLTPFISCVSAGPGLKNRARPRA